MHAAYATHLLTHQPVRHTHRANTTTTQSTTTDTTRSDASDYTNSATSCGTDYTKSDHIGYGRIH